MKTNKLFAAVVAVLSLVACSKNETSQFGSGRTFTVGTESYSTGTKTSLGSNKEVLWSDGDLLSVWAGTDAQTEYRLSSGAGTTSGSITAVGDEASGETDLSANVAVYPYIEEEDADNSSVSITEADDTYTIEGLTLSQHQEYAAGSFANGSYPMVAVTSDTEDESFAFKNLLGAVKLTLTGDATIKRILFTGNDGYEYIAGDATVTASNSGDPSIEIEENGNEATSSRTRLRRRCRP